MTGRTFLVALGIESLVFLVVNIRLDRLRKDRHGGPMRIETGISGLFPSFYEEPARRLLPLMWITLIAIIFTVLVYSCASS